MFSTTYEEVRGKYIDRFFDDIKSLFTRLKHRNNIYVFDCAGFDKDEIDITFENGYLYVTGKKVIDEIGPLEVNHNVYIGFDVNPEDIHAKMINGLLIVKIGKPESVKVKVNIS